MKRFFTSLMVLVASLPILAQGWPSQYEGVMLQGFYWDSFSQSQWVKLEKQADELSRYFKLVWLPQSASCNGTSMGYDDLYWFPGHYDSSFGTETELRSLINTFKAKGIGTIADVVINHRKNISSWVDFPKETYKGVTYELKSTDICADDDGGKTKTWASQNGYSVSSNNDTGEGWDGMRDLDHKSENVQTNVQAYLGMLLNDLGYVGFRYDMVKGYAGSYTKLYNQDSQPQFSVGEYWDGNATAVRNWINATGKTSAAFDFPFRYTVRDAINNNDWRKLSGTSLITDDNFKRYSVTFVENHDTEKRSNADQDPIRKDTLAANAFLLAMPGTPCVFYRHWIDCKQDIKAMIDVRNAAGIHNQSEFLQYASQQTYFVVGTTGSKGELMVVVGSGAANYSPNARFVKVLSGYHYAYYLSKSMETAWADLPSGEYEGQKQVTLTAVSSNSNAKLVYTTDGSTPTASSTKVASGTKITVADAMTLKVGLLIGNAVSGIVTRIYSKADPTDKRSITVYVNTDNVGWTAVNFWTWGGDDSHSPVNNSWPGDKETTTTNIGGKYWYSKQYTINGDDDFVNFVFSTGSGTPQTVDINNISTDKFFEISSQKNGSKYLVNDVTDNYTGISSLTSQHSPLSIYYDLSGRRLNGQSTKKGLYIVNGRKIVRK